MLTFCLVALALLVGYGIGWLRYGFKPWDSPEKPKVTAGTLADKYRTPPKSGPRTMGRGGH